MRTKSEQSVRHINAVTSIDSALVCFVSIKSLMFNSESDQGDCRGRTRLSKVFGVALGCITVSSLACSLVYLYWHDPATTTVYPKCVFRSVTGLWCPGCGLSRGFYAFLHGDFIAAIKMNLLVFVVAPGLAAIVCVARRIGTLKVIDILACVLSLLFWVVRNVPFWPFSLLSPH